MKFSLRPGVQEGGYVLLGIAIGLVIMGIFMGAAVPVWEHVNQRDREEELLWRGKQYVRAIERYQRKYPGAFPAKVEDLVKDKFLRKAYEDPMSEEGEWTILRQNSPEVKAITGVGGGRRQTGQGQQGQQSQQGLASRERSRSLGQSSGLGQRSMTGQALGGIIGVSSMSEDEAIRKPGKKEELFLQTAGSGEKYNEWLFIFVAARNPQQQNPGGARLPGGRPGQQQPGQPGNRGPGWRQNPGGNNPRSPAPRQP